MSDTVSSPTTRPRPRWGRKRGGPGATSGGRPEPIERKACEARPTGLRRGAGWLAALALAAPPPALAATASPAPATPHVCEAQVAQAAKRYDIPLAVFYAVGLLETGGRDGLQPYTMNIEGRSAPSASLAEALATFEAAHRRGANLIDIGCMQINYRWHGEHFASVTEMFDPAHNVDYAARFLRELKTREKTWTMAVARYNAGPNNNAAQKQYVCGVIRRMVDSGFGSWTDNARAFCGQHPA